MAEERLKRNLAVALDPGPDFPGHLWLSRTMAAIESDLGRRGRNVRGGSRGSRTLLPLVAALLAVVIVLGLVFASRALVPTRPTPAVPGPTSGPVQGSQSALGIITGTWGWRSEIGEVSRTDDGGATWTNVNPAGVTPLNTYYIDATHAWIVATPQPVSSGIALTGPVQLVVFRTEDAGRTWERGRPVTSNSFSWIVLLKYGPIADFNLFFVDSAHGWLLVPDQKSRVLYTTSNGGLDWKVVARDSVGQGTPCRWTRMAFVTLTTGWMTDNCRAGLAGQSSPLSVTHDGGATWHLQRLPVTAANVCSTATSLCFVDCPPVFGLQADYYPASWPGCLNPPSFFDAQHGVLLVWQTSGTHAKQTLLVTADGGNSWSVRKLPGEQQLEVQFLDADVGWAVAGSSTQFTVNTNSSGMTSFEGPPLNLPLYHTVDGGSTWTQVSTNLLLQSPEYGMFLSFHFIDADHGYANYNRGRPFTTLDGGRSWSAAPLAPLPSPSSGP